MLSILYTTLFRTQPVLTLPYLLQHKAAVRVSVAFALRRLVVSAEKAKQVEMSVCLDHQLVTKKRSKALTDEIEDGENLRPIFEYIANC